MKKQNIVVRTLKNRIRKNEDIWTTKKAEKALLQIAGALTFIVIVNSLINIAQAEPTVHYLENKPIDYGTSIDPESEHLNDARHDEGKDGTAVDIVSTETIEEKIAKTFPEDSKTAIAIARAESGLKADNVGDGHIMFLKDGKPMGMSCGLFQIRVLEGRPDCESLKDVKTNLEIARKLYDKGGWTAWSVYNNGAYLKFL